MGIITASDGLKVKGKFKLSLFDAKTGEFIDSRERDNLVVTVGLNLVASGLNWAMIQNQNASWGSPFSAVNLGNLYGAMGTSSSAPSSGQTQLVAEIGRAIVSSGGASANVLVYDFFVGTSTANGAITEVGAFMQAGQVSTSLTSALANGSNYTSLSVASTGADIPSGSSIVIGYGSGTTQTVTTSADAPPGSTTISVVSFNANANYSGGTVVAYNYGTMLDRTTFAAITKTSAMTAILEVTLTLVSG